MKKLVWGFCIVVFACTNNQVNLENQDPLIESNLDSTVEILEEDSIKGIDSNVTFLEFYKKLTKAIEAKNYQELNECIYSDFGIYIISSSGAMPEIYKYYDITNYKSKFQPPFLELDFNAINTLPIFDYLPKVICGKEIYDKKGCFAAEANPLLDSQIWNYANLNVKEIQAIEVLVQTIKITVVNTSNFTFYFSEIEGKWYLTFLDLRVPCAA